jgi:hypothetical protein
MKYEVILEETLKNSMYKSVILCSVASFCLSVLLCVHP